MTETLNGTRHTGRLSLLQGTALYVGAALGTGVLALPALAAKAAGPASLLAWLALVLGSIPLAATFAALGARYPDAGGVATYVQHAFGPSASAVVGWCFYSAIPAGAPAAGLFAGAYVAAAVGGGRRTVLLTATALTLLVAVANAFGVRVSGRVQLLSAGLLVALLLAALLTAAPAADTANLHPFAPHGWRAVGSAAALLMWSFASWEAITHLTAEFRRPDRDLPRATALVVVLVGALYLAVAVASVLVLGRRAGGSGAPLAELLARGVGGYVRLVAAAAALLLTVERPGHRGRGPAAAGPKRGRAGVRARPDVAADDRLVPVLAGRRGRLRAGLPTAAPPTPAGAGGATGPGLGRP